jgi:hypothetical protein
MGPWAARIPTGSESSDANRANWDDRVPLHVASRFYDVDGWLAARPGPAPPREADAVGDVSGPGQWRIPDGMTRFPLTYTVAATRV